MLYRVISYNNWTSLEFYLIPSEGATKLTLSQASSKAKRLKPGKYKIHWPDGSVDEDVEIYAIRRTTSYYDHGNIHEAYSDDLMLDVSAKGITTIPVRVDQADIRIEL